MDDSHKNLEFLADRAKELLDRQISSFKSNHAKAGSVIAVIAIFTPMFLFLIEKSTLVIKLISIIPVGLIVISIIYMIGILRAKKMDQGFNTDQFDKLVNESYEDVLLYEIGAKRDSYIDNEQITKKQNENFNTGLNYLVVAILLSFLILIGNGLTETKSYNNMSKDNNPKKEQSVPKDKAEPQKKTIPKVPKNERTQINEGKEKESNKDSLND